MSAATSFEGAGQGARNMSNRIQNQNAKPHHQNTKTTAKMPSWVSECQKPRRAVQRNSAISTPFPLLIALAKGRWRREVSSMCCDIGLDAGSEVPGGSSNLRL